MIHLILRRPFLVLTLGSFLVSCTIEIFKLEYDDGALGALMFLVMFILGFIRSIVRMTIYFDSNVVDQWRFLIEGAMSVLLAVIFDYIISFVKEKMSRQDKK